MSKVDDEIGLEFRFPPEDASDFDHHDTSGGKVIDLTACHMTNYSDAFTEPDYDPQTGALTCRLNPDDPSWLYSVTAFDAGPLDRTKFYTVAIDWVIDPRAASSGAGAFANIYSARADHNYNADQTWQAYAYSPAGWSSKYQDEGSGTEWLKIGPGMVQWDEVTDEPHIMLEFGGLLIKGITVYEGDRQPVMHIGGVPVGSDGTTITMGRLTLGGRGEVMVIDADFYDYLHRTVTTGLTEITATPTPGLGRAAVPTANYVLAGLPAEGVWAPLSRYQPNTWTEPYSEGGMSVPKVKTAGWYVLTYTAKFALGAAGEDRILNVQLQSPFNGGAGWPGTHQLPVLATAYPEVNGAEVVFRAQAEVFIQSPVPYGNPRFVVSARWVGAGGKTGVVPSSEYFRITRKARLL